MRALELIAARRDAILRSAFNFYLATGIVIWIGLIAAQVTA